MNLIKEDIAVNFLTNGTKKISAKNQKYDTYGLQTLFSTFVFPALCKKTAGISRVATSYVTNSKVHCEIFR